MSQEEWDGDASGEGEDVANGITTREIMTIDMRALFDTIHEIEHDLFMFGQAHQMPAWHDNLNLTDRVVALETKVAEIKLGRTLETVDLLKSAVHKATQEFHDQLEIE